MRCAKLGGDRLGRLGLGRRTVKADGERLQIGGADGRRRGDERGRVDAAGEEHADGDVRDQVRADAVAHRLADGVAERVRRQGTPAIVEVRVARVCERAAAPAAVLRVAPPAAGWNRFDITLPRERRRHTAPAQKREDPRR